MNFKELMDWLKIDFDDDTKMVAKFYLVIFLIIGITYFLSSILAYLINLT